MVYVHCDGSVKQPMDHAPTGEVIGYLGDHPSGNGVGFRCLDCGPDPDHRCEVRGINLNPYKATCVVCQRVIVTGCGVELFDGK